MLESGAASKAEAKASAGRRGADPELDAMAAPPAWGGRGQEPETEREAAPKEARGAENYSLSHGDQHLYIQYKMVSERNASSARMMTFLLFCAIVSFSCRKLLHIHILSA